MKKLYTLFICLGTFLTSSCKDEAHVKVTNSIQNVVLEYVSLGDNVPVATSISFGQSDEVQVDHKMDNIKFPMEEHLMFYMSTGEHKVLLYSKEKYTLDKGDNLQIVVTENMEVINPALSIDITPGDTQSIRISELPLILGE